MAIKQLARDTVRTVSSVWETIQDVAYSGRTDSPRTCWNAIGLYLYRHPELYGIVWFYGSEGEGNLVNRNTKLLMPPTVNHVMLTDLYGKALRDTAGGHRTRTGYKAPHLDEQWTLMAKKNWLASKGENEKEYWA